jgi:hypothetical protein
MPLGIFYVMNQIAGFIILLFAALLIIVSSVTVKKASAISFTNGPCPSGEARDYMGICFPLNECKASISAQPGSCTQSEKYAGCPSGQIKDWAGICFKESEAKACPTCAPGSAAAAEKPSTSPPKIEPIKIPPPTEKPAPIKSTEKPHCTHGTKPHRFPNGMWICFYPHGRL